MITAPKGLDNRRMEVNPLRGWICYVGSIFRRLKPTAIHGRPCRAGRSLERNRY